MTSLVVSALAMSAAAEAKNYAPCRTADGSSVALRYKPRKCTLGGPIHYQQAPLIKLRWRSWGGTTAHGRGRFIYNMGFNEPVRVKLFRRRDWEEGVYVFRRARICIRGKPCRTMKLPTY